MKTHPAADVFPMLVGEDLQALTDDIATNGLRHALVSWIDEDGAEWLLDGRNRLAACQGAGVEPRWFTYDGDDPIGYVVSVNVKRRHLNAGQLAALALRVMPLYEAQVAVNKGGRPTGKPGADRPQVSESKRAPRARDLAAKATGASGRGIARARRIIEKAPDLMTAVEAGMVAIDAAEKELRGREAKARGVQRQAEWDAAASRVGDRIDVRHGDFRTVLADLEPGSVDAIVTDPPYADEFLPLWSDLAEVAAKILRPGAPMFAWSGQYRLPEVLARIVEHLEYQWTIVLHMPGANSRFMATHMVQTWKPIIVASPGRWGPHAWHPDRVVGTGKDQELYEWQQDPDPAAELIARYVPEGGLVVDPFVGVGSFGVAAVTTGRRFIGVELDAERHRTASGRIADALH